MLAASSWVNLANAADLIVVIDDVGYNKARGLRAINLPGAVTIAVLPFAPHTASLIQQATKLDKNIIVHQPMEPHPSGHAREEHDTLKLHMPDGEFDTLVQRALDAVPMGTGLSNHTGSLLTQHRTPMLRLMRHLSERGLFFLDSRTTTATIALDVAREVGVAAIRRDVFLDHHRNIPAIHRAFEKALKIARTRGSAVVVAHPYPISLDYLEDRLTHLPKDIRLISAEHLAIQRRAELALAQHPGFPHISPGQ